MHSYLSVFLKILICCLLYPGVKSQTLYDYSYRGERDPMHWSFNLELSKITHQVQIGRDVQLDCVVSDDDTTITPKSPVSWHFRPCGHGSNQSSCHQNIESEDSTSWHKLICPPDSDCDSSLVINNVTEKDSGFYRCSIYPFKPNDWTTLQIQVVKTYFLDVRNTTIAPPNIVENIVRNTTALVDSQVVFTCCVHSRIQPTIMWLKRQETPLDDSTKVIEYQYNKYVQLESAGEKVLNDGVYLSKLILNRISVQNEGWYVCIAINYGGYNFQSAYLSVLDSDDEMSDENELGNSTLSLFLLFLIPFGLALAPLTLWMCYLLFRGRRVKEIDENIDKRKDYIRVNRNIV